MNKNKAIVCCVICLSEDGKILFIKRGRDPYKGKWSLIGGVGYSKQNLTPEQGVYLEVVGDVVAEPSDVEYLFTISYDNEDVQVFQAHVDSQKVTPQIPYAVDVAWCSENEIKELGELAFEHSDILDKFFFR